MHQSMYKRSTIIILLFMMLIGFKSIGKTFIPYSFNIEEFAAIEDSEQKEAGKVDVEKLTEFYLFPNFYAQQPEIYFLKTHVLLLFNSLTLFNHAVEVPIPPPDSYFI